MSSDVVPRLETLPLATLNPRCGPIPWVSREDGFPKTREPLLALVLLWVLMERTLTVSSNLGNLEVLARATSLQLRPLNSPGLLLQLLELMLL